MTWTWVLVQAAQMTGFEREDITYTAYSCIVC